MTGLVLLSVLFSGNHNDLSAVSTILMTHCVPCHDGNAVDLDLRNLSDTDTSGVWQRVLEKVESQQMPPPKRVGSVQARFPMPAEARAQLVSGILSLMGTSADRNMRDPYMFPSLWLSVAQRLAEGIVPTEEVVEATAVYLTFNISDRHVVAALSPVYQTALDTASRRACRLIRDEDLKKPAAQRHLLAELTPDAPNNPSKARLLSRLFRAVFSHEPSPTELRREAKFFEAVHEVSNDWPEAWVAMCSAFLASPELLYALRFKRQ